MDERLRPNPRRKAAAQNLIKGMKIKPALMQAGYAENTANRGRASIGKAILFSMGKEAKQFEELGRIDAATQERIVRGGLVYNTLTRSDKGVMSMKALGSDRRVNMFTPEVQQGIIVIGQPKDVEAKDEKWLEGEETK